MATTNGHAPDSSGLQHVGQDPWSQEKQVAVFGSAPQVAPSHDYNAGLIPTTDVLTFYKDSASILLSSPQGQDSRGWWRRHRRAAIFTACVVLVCIIVGGVVGGVLGSRKSSGSAGEGKDDSNAPDGNDSKNPNNSSNPNNPTPNVRPNLIRPNSRLSVAGFRVGAAGEDMFNIRLFYQGQDDLVRYSTFKSQFNWSKPAVAGLDAIPGTPLAACANIQYDPAVIQLYYLNKDSHLMGQNFTNLDTAPQAGTPDTTINGKIPDKFENARLSSYNPFLLVQEASGGRLRAYYWKMERVNVPNATVWEDQSRLNGVDTLLGTAGTSIVALPITSEYYYSGAFIYGRGDGTLSTYALAGKGDPTGTAWDATPSLSVPIPKAASIGAFTVARSTSRTILDVNTYILYQAENGTNIQMVWQDDETGDWKGPRTFPALDGADKGTDITCVTQAAVNGRNVWLKTISSINRCYFQSQGAVKEVMYDGKDWQNLGFVPIE